MLPKFKIMKIKSTLPQRVGKITLWALVVFLVLRGIGSMFKPNEAQTAKDVIKNFTSQTEYKDTAQYEASAFSEAFAMEFMTYDGTNPDDYSNRLKKYIPTYLELNIPFGNDSKAEALSAEAGKVTWESQNQLNIDVRVKVRYTQKIKQDDLKSGETISTDKVTVNDTYLRVPIAEKDGKYLIEDYPAFIPEPDKANIKYVNYSGKNADSGPTKEITGVLENFFKTYYNGNSSEITYYLLDSSKEVKGLEKRYEFLKLDSANVYLKDDKDKYFAIVALTVKDSVNGQALPQRFHVDLVKKDDRYYIENFDVRVGNLNKSENNNN